MVSASKGVEPTIGLRGRARDFFFGPPHGSALCWLARIAALAWGGYFGYMLAVHAAGGEDFIPVYVVSAIGLAAVLAGMRWHLASAMPLVSLGAPWLCAPLLHHPIQLCPQTLLFNGALLAAGLLNIAALLHEREWTRPKRLETAAGLVFSLPGLVLCILCLWAYATLGDDCEWGQDSIMGGLTVVGGAIGLALSFVGIVLGAWLFRGAWRLWHWRRASHA